MQLEALRSYLHQIARLPLLEPSEERELCRQIEVAHEALAAALLTVPSAARRLRERCALVSGAPLRDDRPLDAQEIVEALNRGARARCKAMVRVRVDAAVADQRVDSENGAELVASIERSQSSTPLRSMFVEELAADVLATAEGDRVQCVSRRLEGLQELKRRLTEANLALVVSIAARFRHGDLPLLALVQEGNRGLMKAVDRFECQRGVEFSTYATWWIRQSIRRTIQPHDRHRSDSNAGQTDLIA